MGIQTSVISREIRVKRQDCKEPHSFSRLSYLAPHVGGPGDFGQGDVELSSGDDGLDAAARSVQELDQPRNKFVSGLGVSESAVASEAPREGLKIM